VRLGVVIDLGTVNTLVYTPRHGIIIEEPSVVAVQRSPSTVLSVGRSADALYGRAPEGVDIVKPLHDGVVHDLEACTLMLGAFMRRVFPHYRPGRLDALVCVPGGATDVERTAVVEAACTGTPRFRAKLVDETVAAALGTGVDQNGGKAVLVIDIGGGTTEIGVVVAGGNVVSRSIRIAGNEMDKAIVRAVRAQHGLVISERTGERLKIAAGLSGTGDTVAVTGVDATRWGWLRTVEVTPKLVAAALERPVNTIITALTDLLAEVPADLAEEILDGGVHLAGGGALLQGAAERIGELTCCNAKVVPDPLRCVVRGMASMLGYGTRGVSTVCSPPQCSSDRRASMPSDGLHLGYPRDLRSDTA
jgi:rod shape-determining protein MreB and related proteins